MNEELQRKYVSGIWAGGPGPLLCASCSLWEKDKVFLKKGTITTTTTTTTTTTMFTKHCVINILGQE